MHSKKLCSPAVRLELTFVSSVKNNIPEQLAAYASLDEAARVVLNLAPHAPGIPAARLAHDLAHTIAYLMVHPCSPRDVCGLAFL